MTITPITADAGKGKRQQMTVSESREDKSLGMDQRISRRDFLNSTLLASGSLLMTSLTPMRLLGEEDDWTGYSGVGDYSTSNGNTLEVLAAGHRIRDGEFDRLPTNTVDTDEIYDCVVVGGGISGLAAALFFMRNSGKNRTCLVLDDHPVFGGEAKRNEFLVDGHRLMAHQGSAVFFVQYPPSFLGRFYDSIGLKTPRLQYQKWAGPEKEMALSKTPYDMVGSEPATYGLYFGAMAGGSIAGGETATVFWRRDFAVPRLDYVRRAHDAALRHQPRNYSDFPVSSGRWRVRPGA